VPRRAVHTSTGGALGLSTTGGAVNAQPFLFANHRLKVAVAQAGDAKVGTVDVYIRGSFATTVQG
jgi:hypothetical protein